MKTCHTDIPAPEANDESAIFRQRATESLGYDPYDENRTPVNGGPEAVVRNAVARINKELAQGEAEAGELNRQSMETMRRMRGER